MATKKSTTTTAAAETATTTETTAADTTKTATAAAEPEYTVAEFAAAASAVFGTKPDIVTAALRMAGVTKTTKSAAIEIVNKFRKKEAN